MKEEYQKRAGVGKITHLRQPKRVGLHKPSLDDLADREGWGGKGAEV